MKVHRVPLLALCGLLAAVASTTAVERPAYTKTMPAGNITPSFSGNLGEVVKLFQSGVDEGVIVAFVESSPVANQPSADEIIRLRELGISSKVIEAVLRRGGELRAQLPTARVAPTTARPNAAAPQSSAGYSTSGTAPAQTVVYVNGNPYPSYSEPSYSYAYAYAWAYPSYYYYPYIYYYPYNYSYYRYPYYHHARGHFDGRFHGRSPPQRQTMTPPTTGTGAGTMMRPTPTRSVSVSRSTGTIQMGRTR